MASDGTTESVIGYGSCSLLFAVAGGVLHLQGMAPYHRIGFMNPVTTVPFAQLLDPRILGPHKIRPALHPCPSSTFPPRKQNYKGLAILKIT